MKQPPTRLKATQIREYRNSIKPDVCPILGIPLTEHDAVLDHDHDTGRVRGTIHRQANALMGKIENYYRGFMANLECADLRTVLSNIVDWIERDYSHMPIHPKGTTKLVRVFARMPAAQQKEFLQGINKMPFKTSSARTGQFRSWLLEQQIKEPEIKINADDNRKKKSKKVAKGNQAVPEVAQG